MPKGERTAQISVGEHEETSIPLSGSTKNAAQLLHQNIIQNVLRSPCHMTKRILQYKIHSTLPRSSFHILKPALQGSSKMPETIGAITFSSLRAAFAYVRQVWGAFR